MVEITKTQRAFEIVYVACVDIPVKNGRLYMFLAIDDFSTAVFNLNSSLRLNDIDCVNAVEELLTRDEVKKAAKGIHMVVPFNELLRRDIEQLLEPYGGEVSFSVDAVNRVAGPMILEALRGVEFNLTYCGEGGIT